ncbi:cytochrome d ubiquinol oxidase, subunit II [Denitrovibrio acetiphilus DSM 12809]|jgi:cytochrome d ubiquinol oxidase subunit II|uniref:Cytochrome d ubiquinol oxidase, subunit II n=1 Tax=Denitrovibrio acetiphilus (strain DSM 12809 / NBRC 114555 / N2460) TaxID=522772 RepID=D4H215_DENA2|nr:cytochrome d ubiquinol oxidase subunit II [Denitrovibrio acetiphilus]ADD66992.1 cytochrome d ubiquinol oxidase, subunit II [Denitrovibrio acetiphilus DSM 12809]
MELTTLQVVWFALWGLLWAVYFMLDGFDFGAGMLMPFLSESDSDRRVVINTLGPVWDGNEVWLITAGGATFAAFPTTYAYMFSWLYLPLLLILFSLIFRGVGFEFRGKRDTDRWRQGWDITIMTSSFLASLLFGVAFGNIFRGIPINMADGQFVYEGNFFMLLNPYALLTGVLFVLLFARHGALWLSVKTTGSLAERAENMSRKLFIPLVAVAVAFLAATYFSTRLYENYIEMPMWFAVIVLCVTSLIASGTSSGVKAFGFSCTTILLTVFTGIIGLFPDLLPSSISPEFSLTAFNTSSSRYTLTVMTIVVAIFVPLVLMYQIWTYYIFRKPVSPEDVADPEVESY